MKCILNLLAVCCVVAVVGCACTPTSSSEAVSPGAVGPCKPDCTKASCDKAKHDASLGAVGKDCPPCPAKKAADSDANLGAVGDKSAGSNLPPCCRVKKNSE